MVRSNERPYFGADLFQRINELESKGRVLSEAFRIIAVETRVSVSCIAQRYYSFRKSSAGQRLIAHLSEQKAHKVVPNQVTINKATNKIQVSLTPVATKALVNMIGNNPVLIKELGLSSEDLTKLLLATLS